MILRVCFPLMSLHTPPYLKQLLSMSREKNEKLVRLHSRVHWLGSYNDTVAKMASHAIFQYNILAIDDTHNTWTNMIIKLNIRRLLGSSDDKEKISVARPEGPPLRDKN